MMRMPLSVTSVQDLFGFYGFQQSRDCYKILSEGAQAVKWTCDGSPEFTLEDIKKEDRGTDIILYIDEELKSSWNLTVYLLC